MIRFCAAHPTAANLLMLVLVFSGLSVLPNIKRETFPEIKQNEVEATVLYPGATPLDVEQKLCRPLEDAIEGISFLEELRCEARHSKAIAVVKMQEQGDLNTFINDVNSAVDGIDNFPDDAETPVVQELGRMQDVVTVAMTANLNDSELKDLAELVKQRMMREPGIPHIEIAGFSKRQLQIQISQDYLRQYGFSIQTIADLIAAQDLDLPLGEITTQYRDYQIRFRDERRSAADLADLIIVKGDAGTELRLGDIATIVDHFESDFQRVYFNGQPAALFKIKKNSLDDSLKVLQAVKTFIANERQRLPSQVGFFLTQDFTSIVKDRIKLLLNNAWQGLFLVFAVMWLFFGGRYAFWVVMGLPVSFLGSAFILAKWGISINMLSMVALLLALGLLMDDAIVISESIGAEIGKGKRPLQAAVEGTQKVARGVLSSFATTLCVFIGLLFITGDIGQMLKTIPIVLIAVLSISLLEAFFILPNHLFHALKSSEQKEPQWIRKHFAEYFERLHRCSDDAVVILIRFRYFFIGLVGLLFILSLSLVAGGVVRFSAFPDLEGDVLQARVMMPVGTSLSETERTVDKINQALQAINRAYRENYGAALVNSVSVHYGTNADAFESGAHLATLSVDMITSDSRRIDLNTIAEQWRKQLGDVPEVLSIAIKEPAVGPAGQAIAVRIQGDDLEQLSMASHVLQNWLSGYPGVNNLFDDLRPGKPEFTLKIKPGAVALGLDARTIAGQLRAAYQGVEVMETNVKLETYHVTVILADKSKNQLSAFDNFPIIHPETGQAVPLSNIAEIIPTRSFSRIERINAQRSVSIYGDVDSRINNTQAILDHLQQIYLDIFRKMYPDFSLSFQGEIDEGTKTRDSMQKSLLFGLFGIFVLLSIQFKNYSEPLLVMVNIPLALIGVIWGHWILGHDITLPSLLGFVSLAGIVVNDSILLVEFVKQYRRSGSVTHTAAAQASHDRFRAVLLTSLTTIAGLTPLLFEQSLQAQVLIPLAISIIFGIATSTLLVLFVIPCLYAILEDLGNRADIPVNV